MQNLFPTCASALGVSICSIFGSRTTVPAPSVPFAPQLVKFYSVISARASRLGNHWFYLRRLLIIPLSLQKRTQKKKVIFHRWRARVRLFKFQRKCILPE